MESIGQLSAGIAHEINTPIQYVGDNLRFLKRSFNKIIDVLTIHQQFITDHINHAITPEAQQILDSQTDQRRVKRYVSEIPSAIDESEAGVERVRKIVLAMREFSHPSMKEKRLSDINHGIETTATISRNAWKYAAELVTDLDPDLPLVYCYIDEINQVILNMIINSAQAIQERQAQNPEEKGTITITTRQRGESVIITIEDTGCGIPDAIQDRVFDPFFTTKDVGTGTGQGLFLAHNIIVQGHKGLISFESEPGQGAKFFYRAADRGGKVNAKKHTVLFVDDDPLILRGFSRSYE
jgi:signal transduction histidine kinase